MNRDLKIEGHQRSCKPALHFEANKVYGLRDVGAYKVYCKGAAYFASHKDSARLRRIQINRGHAELLIKKTKSDFALDIEQRLNAGKRACSPNYFEVKHP